jgi:hypothetical protein
LSCHAHNLGGGPTESGIGFCAERFVDRIGHGD